MSEDERTLVERVASLAKASIPADDMPEDFAEAEAMWEKSRVANARAIIEEVADVLEGVDYVSQGTYPYCEGNCARWLRNQAQESETP